GPLERVRLEPYRHRRQEPGAVAPAVIAGPGSLFFPTGRGRGRLGRARPPAVRPQPPRAGWGGPPPRGRAPPPWAPAPSAGGAGRRREGRGARERRTVGGGQGGVAPAPVAAARRGAERPPPRPRRYVHRQADHVGDDLRPERALGRTAAEGQLGDRLTSELGD